jgi:hypothetical protein
MKPHTAILAVLILAATLSAQTSTTSPKGLDKLEGNSHILFWGPKNILQVIDDTNRKARTIQSLAFRQDSVAKWVGSGKKGSADVVVTMSQTAFHFIDLKYTANMRSNTSVVFKGKVVLPDWTKLPWRYPAPFDLVIKWTKPWVYDGKSALVWQVEVGKSTSSGRHAMDADYTGAQVPYGLGKKLGTGCGGYVGYLLLRNSGNYSPVTGMHFELWSSTGGPPNSPTWLLIDGKDSNLSIPGLCARLHALPTIIAPMGNTDAKGALTTKYLNLPYLSSIQGASFVTQLLTLAPAQPGLPFGITNGQQAKMPANPGTYGHATVSLHGWTPKSTSLSMGIVYGGAPIALLK